MSVISVNENLKNMFLAFVENLSEETRIDIIAKLTDTVKHKKDTHKDANYFSGKWNSAKSAELINQEIIAARVSNRKIEDL
jgi:hypothetical protein